MVAQMVKNWPSMWKTWVQSLGQEDSLEEDSQYSCLENPMDRGTRQATAYEVAESDMIEAT